MTDVPGQGQLADGTDPVQARGQNSRFRFANAEFDEGEGTLRVGGELADIEPRPLRLLVELLRRPNEVVTKDELFESVWNGRVTVDHVLANSVSKLRAALGAEAGARIVTVPRVGYRLNGPVQRFASPPRRNELKAGHPVPGREGYLLERSLGQESRSEVWLARHAKLGQAHVFKFASDAVGLNALKREYTLFRVLNTQLGPREDIARITDTQFQSAPYFLESDYAGQNLLAWGEEGDRLVQMCLALRLALFIQIAAAVAAAHSVGVLHKDLKPANVLVAQEADRWRVRLVDFGSGRLLDPAQLEALKLTALGMTQTGLASEFRDSGTFLYLAPELLAGHSPTIQSDVYSLGVLLWQLVVADLRRPLASGWERSVDDALLVEEIAAATDGSPERRTPSVAILLRNLQQLEARRQERARREADAAVAATALADRQRRLAIRPWVMVGTTGLVVGLAASSTMAWRADRARAQEHSARAQVQAVSDFLHHDVLDSPDVLTSGRVQPVQLLDVMRRAASTASERFHGQPLAEATVRRKIAETFLRRSSVAEAIVQLRKAETLLDAAGAPDSDALLAVRFLLARSLIWGQNADGLRLLESSEALAGPWRIAAMTDLGAQASRARLEQLLDAGRAREAVPLAQRLVEQTDALFPEQSPRRIDARQKLAETYVRAGLRPEAEALFKVLSDPPYNQRNMDHEFRARELAVRAEKLLNSYRVDEAEPLVAEWRQLMVDQDPPNPFYLAWAEIQTGDCHWLKGRFGEALRFYKASLPLFAESVGPDHAYIAVAQLHVAQAAQESGHHEAALALFSSVDMWHRRHAGKSGHEAAQFGRVRALIDLGRPAEALEALAAIDLAKLAVYDITPGRDAWVRSERARALMRVGRRDEARALLQQSVPQLEAARAPSWLVNRFQRLLRG